MRRIGLSAVGFLGLALALTSPAAARPLFGGGPPGPPPYFEGGPHGPPDGGFVGHHADRLGLGEETQATIEEIVATSRAEGEELREQLRAARERMHELLSEEVPEEEAVLGQAEVIGGLETELHKHRLRSLLAIGAHLTPEQRAELARIREEGPFRRFRDLREACAEDLEALCADAGPGPRAFFCLRRHAEDLSGACAEALDAMPRHRHRHGHFGRGF